MIASVPAEVAVSLRAPAKPGTQGIKITTLNFSPLAACAMDISKVFCSARSTHEGTIDRSYGSDDPTSKSRTDLVLHWSFHASVGNEELLESGTEVKVR